MFLAIKKKAMSLKIAWFIKERKRNLNVVILTS